MVQSTDRTPTDEAVGAEPTGTQNESDGRGRRSFLRYAGGGGAAALAAGCKEREFGDRNVDTFTPADGGGTDSGSAPPQPLSGESIRLGCLAPQPESFPVGQSMWNSMQMAVEDLNENGVPVWQQWQVDEEISDDYGVMHSFAPGQNKTSPYAYPGWIDYPSDHPANTEGPPGRDNGAGDL